MTRMGFMLNLEEARFVYQKIYNRDLDDEMTRKLVARLSDLILDMEAEG